MVLQEAILIMQKNIVIYFAHGVVFGLGLNFWLSYESLTRLQPVLYFLGIALIGGCLLSLGFFEYKFRAKVTTKQKWRVALFGVAAASVALAFLNFIQNLGWFVSGGPLMPVNVQTSISPPKFVQLTIYPPNLIYDLLKSTFFAAVAGFAERMVSVFA